jgi:hypothetical protein
VVDLETIEDEDVASGYGVEVGTKLMKYDFVLVGEEEARRLRDRNSIEALEGLGMKVKIVDGLPIPDVD